MIGNLQQTELLFQSFAQKAVTALIKEATLTPKPGLVDADNSGSHKDMDLALLVRSAEVFTPYFYAYCMTGFTYGFELAKIFPTLRRIGWRAEQNMFFVTHGINTHKGANFSFAVFLSSLGAFYRQRTNHAAMALSWQEIATLFLFTKQICLQLVANDFAQLTQKTARSHGEQLYVTHRFAGIRAEIEHGFPTLQQHILPLLQAPQQGLQAERYLVTLLQLMSYLDDSNIIYRGGFQALEYVKTVSRNAVLVYKTEPAKLTALLYELNAAFALKNLSPGGSADLLALAIFIDSLVQPTPALSHAPEFIYT